MKFKKRSLVLIITAAFFGLVIAGAAIAGDVFEEELEREKIAVKLAREVQVGKYDLVTTEELRAWISEGKEMTIIDAMPLKHYRKKHIPGAEQFLFPIPEMLDWDVGETGGKTAQEFEELLGPDKQKPIVVYCGFVKCGRSHNGAMWAKRLGYEHVYRHPGGIYAWQGADYEMASME